MGSLFRIFLTAVLFFIIPVFTFACDIFVNIDGVKKEKYGAGDIVIIRVEVRLTHRNCPVDINETRLNASGMQIIGATKWVNMEGSNKWERRIKVKISSEKDGKAMLVAERVCQKDGGKGSLILAT